MYIDFEDSKSELESNNLRRVNNKTFNGNENLIGKQEDFEKNTRYVNY